MTNRRTRLKALSAVVVACLASGSVAAPARGDVDQVRGPRATHDGMRLTRVTFRNTSDEVRVTARVKGLHRGRWQLALDLDAGRRDTFDDTTLTHLVLASARRPENARLLRVTDGVFGDPYLDRVACAGLDVRWRYAEDRVRVTVPQGCLGADAGMMRATFELSYRPCLCDGPWTRAQSRVLQRGERGARYFDVNGDGRVDRVLERSPRQGRYRVIADLGRRTVRASAPRAPAASWDGARPISGLDIDRDGRAEVIGDPADSAGDGSIAHVFRFARGDLRLVRTSDGSPFELLASAAGQDYFHSYRCARGRLQTWDLESVTEGPPRVYTLDVTPWSFDRGRATEGEHRTVTVPASSAVQGNWSLHSCATR